MKTLTFARVDRRVIAVVVTAIALLALTMFPSGAQAHSELESSTPAEGASVSTLAEFSLTFGEEVTPEFSSYTLTDGTTSSIKLGTPRYDATKTTVTVPLAQMVGGGDYTIGYSILSIDGHKVAGTVHFTSTAAVMGPGSHDMDGDHTGPPPSGMPVDHDHDHDGFGPDGDDDGDSGKAIWFALGGAILGAVIVAVIAWLIRRRGSKSAVPAAADEAAQDAPAADASTAQDKPTQDKPKRAPKKSDD
jgi:methionine-rich copper-binding protein CopC